MLNKYSFPANISPQVEELISQRAEEHYREQCDGVAIQIDRVFAILMAVQWLGGILAAWMITPRTWIGTTSLLHVHVIAAFAIGGALSLPVIYLALVQPGAWINRYIIGVSQVLTSALLIHLTGGRIETHFHVFGSLAFLALYREWRVLIAPTVVVALDHFVRGTLWPESVFGVATSSNWRWLEHAGWVLFEDSVLVSACVRAQKEMRALANQWAYLSVTKEIVDDEVESRVAELRISEERLRIGNLKTRTIIETANDAFVSIGLDGSVQEWSTRAEALFGWKGDEVIGRNIHDLLQTSEISKLLSSSTLENMIKSGAGLRSEMTALHRGGHQIPVEASVSVMRFEDCETINLFFHDVSERNALQMRLLHAQKMEGIGQLAAGIAHEINTPTQYVGDNMHFVLDSLRNVDRLLEHLADNESGLPPSVEQWESWRAEMEEAELPYLREEVPRAIEQALDGIGRIAQITRAMKEFSHPGTREKEVVDPRRIIENSITVCRNEWKYVSTIEQDFDPELTSLPCLPGELSQVLVILIVNAAQAISGDSQRRSEEMGTITVRTRKNRELAEISVSDNGPGIPANIVNRIFEPFFTTKEVGKGTGQGLAIAHTVVVDKHGGTIDVSPNEDGGTTFTIRLPFVEQEQVA